MDCDATHGLPGGAPRDPAPALRALHGIADVRAEDWDRLAGPQPFLRHAFLHALEATRCVGAGAGWLPRHLTLWRGGRLAAAMPLYLKSHSYGEYVFDWAWADAYARSGLRYYPKLLAAIPFTPVTGARLLAESDDDRGLLLAAALQHAQDSELSSFHCLFPTEAERAFLEDAGLMIRHGVQFHWLNPGYRDFGDYLAALSHAKRKKIRQERRRVTEQGIAFRRLTGPDITDDDWAFFAGCYENTYRRHGSTPYLTLEFFRELGRAMADSVLLIVARQGGRDIAAALNLFDAETLYGRYWGARGHFPGLHFETCYYQAIEFCIARGIARFEGGAQGEHKLARGFLPTRTWSAHWLAHPGFSGAVEDFLAREAHLMADYIGEMNEHSPYRGARG